MLVAEKCARANLATLCKLRLSSTPRGERSSGEEREIWYEERTSLYAGVALQNF